jgi:hypothetical protein
MLQPLKVEVFALISNALGNGRAPNCSRLSFLTKTSKNPTKLGNYDMGN